LRTYTRTGSVKMKTQTPFSELNKSSLKREVMFGVILVMLAILLCFTAIGFYESETKPSDVRESQERHFAKLELKLTDLAHKQNLTVSILESVGAGIVHADDSHRLTWWNDNAAEMFNYNRLDYFSMCIEDLMDSSVISDHRKAYDKAMERRSGVHGLVCKEARRSDGSLFTATIFMAASPAKGTGAVAIIFPYEVPFRNMNLVVPNAN